MPTGIYKRGPSPHRGRYKEKANSWKGDKAGYFAKHLWLTAHYEKSECEHCGVKAPKRLEWANISGKYLRQREHYKCLCQSCHKFYDYRKRTHCKRGHLFSEENVFYRKEGYRECRVCVRYLVKQNKLRKSEEA